MEHGFIISYPGLFLHGVEDYDSYSRISLYSYSCTEIVPVVLETVLTASGSYCNVLRLVRTNVLVHIQHGIRFKRSYSKLIEVMYGKK